MAGVGGAYGNGAEVVTLGATRGLMVHACPAPLTSLQPPQDLSSCAVVLLPDAFGFDTTETRGMARLLAGEGYATVVPDIYRGKPWPEGVTQGSKTLSEWCASQDRARMLADVKEALIFLRERGVTRLAAVGFSFGAEILLECGALENFFDAGVAFYPTAPSVGMRTRVPTLFVFGGSDEYTLPQAVASLRQHLVHGGTVSDTKVIAGQPHHFVLRGGDAQAIKEAHAQLLGWIGTHVHANSGAWEVGRLTRIPLKEEDWWPEGKGRRFRSAARERWERARETWRVQRRPRPARPPRVAYDSVVEGLAATRRTFELPGRMTLPEIIEVFTDIWEVESTL